jgi:aspartate kinase
MEEKPIIVIKVGGAGLESADLYTKFALKILSLLRKGRRAVVVCSAVKGVTRLLDEILNSSPKSLQRANLLEKLDLLHVEIISELFIGDYLKYASQFWERTLSKIVDDLTSDEFSSFSARRAAMLQHGELVSSKLLSLFLEQCLVNHRLVDARQYVKTEGLLDKAEIIDDLMVSNKVTEHFMELFGETALIITQGFIGSDHQTDQKTILVFNGSDISAGYIAFCLSAKLIFLKELSGVYHPRSKKLAIAIKSMTYGGYRAFFENAKEYPIHPKAIEFAEMAGIPVEVRSFLTPEELGTSISYTV